MKKYLLWFLIAWACIPFSIGVTLASPDGWVLSKQIAEKDWIKNAKWSTSEEKCTTILNRTSCDYTGPSKALRLGYQYEFADEFWAWEQNRQLRAECHRIDEKQDYNQTKSASWTINIWVNPSFSRTPQLINNNYRVNKNKSMVVIKANEKYQINAVPNKRSSDNLLVKYVIEYSNDKDGNTRYQHTECYPYEISRCGDGVVDKDWFWKDKNDPWEECDPNHPNWKDDNSCDPTTCKEKPPVCNSKYNWQTLESLTEWKHLCEVWSWSKFEYNENTHTWTWKCEAAWKWVECSAKKPYDGGFDIKKTLVSESKYVTQTGQELVWDITVTASGWDVKNMKITDKLPEVLEYSWYSIEKLPSWVTIAKDQPTFSTDKKSVYWETKWTLQSWNSIVLRVVTIVTTMPKNTDNYKNVACAAPEGQEKDEKCDDEQIPTEPSLRITKTFTDWTKNKTVKVWDEIAYKISFGNSGGAAATITSIKDFLPKNVEYVSSEIHIQRTYNHSSGTQTWDEEFKGYKVVDGVRIDIYGGLTLEPRDKWYIILTGKVLEKKSEKESTTNFACIYLNDELVACDDATHTFTEEPVSCIPTLEPSSFADVCSSDTSSFSTTVTCKSSWNADIEILCDGVVVKTGHASLLTWTCSATTNNTDHRVQCKINGSLTWTDWKSCEASFRRNTKSCGGSSSCFVAWTKVIMADGSQKNIEDVEIWEKVLWSNGTVNTVLWFHRPLLWEKELWSINGWEYFVTAEHPFMTTEWWKSLNPELTKIWMENLPVWLLKVWDTLITENWNIVIYSLDAKKSAEDTQLYNFKLDGDHTYYADSYLVHNKWWYGTPTCSDVDVKSNGDVTCEANNSAYFKLQCGNKTYYSHKKRSSYTFDGVKCSSNDVKCSVSKYEGEWPWTSNNKCTIAEVPEGYEQCFNVNAWNFSIEEWEIFPFFWNMHNLEVWIDQNKEDVNWYTEIEDSVDSYKRASENLSEYKNTNCTTDDFWKIAKDSMVCTFKIYGGWEQTSPLYTIQWPCLSKEDANPLDTGLIKAWYNKMKDTYCNSDNSDNCYFSFDPDREENRWLLPSAVYYIQKFWTGATIALNGEEWEWNWDLQWNLNKEKNKPYWEYKIVLSSVQYLQCMGDGENNTWQVQSPVDYFVPCQNNFVLTDPYTVQKTPSGNLTASTEKLSKYRYISGSSVFSALLGAISASEYTPNSKVNDAMDAFIKKYEKLAVSVSVWNSSFLEWSNIKKVPWKSIYFVKGNITIKWNSQSIDKPFTIVQTEGKTIIKWNVKHNMMLLTNGDIVFQWNNCTEDQTVKWIFYARWNLKRSWVEKNTNITNNTWCTKGWLHVKWVLIGSNFEWLMKNSRSHLNDWFNTEDKKSSIMNWASVLIEYSPSIFSKSTMPPGAEDFTTALSIYKN